MMSRSASLNPGDPVRVLDPTTGQFQDARFEAAMPDGGIKAEVKGSFTSVSRWYSGHEWKLREDDITLCSDNIRAVPVTKAKPSFPRPIRTAGLRPGMQLVVDGGGYHCGDIQGGVGVHFSDGPISGKFVLDFDDLRQVIADIEAERKARAGG